jgi:tRNA(fMet)-specific endonuclease VapC
LSYLLDTNVCIAYLRGKDQDLLARYKSHPPGDIFVCATVRSELIFGALRSPNPNAEMAVIQAFLAPLQSVAFDDRIADAAAEIRAKLAASGWMIGPYDLQIAATAQVHGFTLVTHNTKEFGRIVGLKLEDWEV